jgi:hypothetical protein
MEKEPKFIPNVQYTYNIVSPDLKQKHDEYEQLFNVNHTVVYTFDDHPEFNCIVSEEPENEFALFDNEFLLDYMLGAKEDNKNQSMKDKFGWLPRHIHCTHVADCPFVIESYEAYIKLSHRVYTEWLKLLAEIEEI